jgi:lysophospholipase L1-like esterase
MVVRAHIGLSHTHVAAYNFHRVLGTGSLHLFPLLGMLMVRDEKPGSLKMARLLALLLSIPVFIILSEIIFAVIPVDAFFQNRFFLVNRALDYPDVFLKDHYLFWRMRPDHTIRSRFFEGKQYHINKCGLRGRDIPAGSDCVRIVALGNSCTFGWGMPDDETFVRQLETMIDDDRTLPRAEVINAGIPGYSSFQGRRFFVSDITALHPDVVLIMFGWNDQWAAADNIPDKDQRMPPRLIIAIQNTLARLETYRIVKKLLLSAIEKPLESKLIKEAPVYRVSTTDFYDNLNVIVQACKREGIVPILLTSPIPSLEKYYPAGRRSPMHKAHNAYNNQTRLLARNTKTGLVDIAREFDRYDDLYDNAAQDPIHFNAKGHRVVARAIYNHLTITGLPRKQPDASDSIQ